MKNQSGFTLMEILMSVIILGIVAVIMNNILATAFTSTQKAETIKEVKINGDYAITAMEITIRDARAIVSDCSDISFPSLEVVSLDGTYTTFSVNGSQILRQKWSDSSHSSPPLQMQNLTSALVDVSDAITGSPTLSFVCEIQSGRPAKVTITFSLRSAQSTIVQTDSTQQFQASFFMRNY